MVFKKQLYLFKTKVAFILAVKNPDVVLSDL